MYQVSNPAVVLRGHRRLLGRRAAVSSRVSRTVVLLGVTSLLTDISSEMVVTVLPLYLVYVGGFSPLAFGVIDGLYNGAAALMGLASGFVGDRFKRHKEVAATGYGLSAICKLGLVAVGPVVSAIGAVVLLDRTGKGIRTAPRDAMISLATPRSQLGAAFGVHRAMDTVGAMIGPLLAFAMLAAAPVAFDSIFVVSFCIALLGVGILVLFVDQRRTAEDAQEPAPAVSLRGATRLLRDARYRKIVLAGGALSLATASDAFVFLALQKKLGLGNAVFPLLFTGSALTFMLLAVPMGRLADRIGRGRVLVGGYVLLLAVYAAVVAPMSGSIVLILALGLLGTYYAATDGVLMAFASAVVPADVRGTGLALLGTTTNVARLLASVAFGALWTLAGMNTAFACFGGALLIAIAIAVTLFGRTARTA